MRFFVLLFGVFFSTFCLGDELDTKLEKILFPCVRVLTGQGGGSGTIIFSEDRESDGEYKSFILSNYHVIDNLIHVERSWDSLRQSYDEKENNDLADVEVFSYANGGKTVTITSYKAEIVAHQKEEDIAILKLKTPFKMNSAVKILPKGKHLRLMQDVYCVGAPLLVNPLVTQGQVINLDYIIDKRSYTGMNANIFYGNSGGSVMSVVDGEYYLVGVPSRVAANNGQVVTYMSYAITPERLQEFIIKQKLLFLIDDSVSPTACFKERDKMRSGQKNGETKEKSF